MTFKFAGFSGGPCVLVLHSTPEKRYFACRGICCGSRNFSTVKFRKQRGWGGGGGFGGGKLKILINSRYEHVFTYNQTNV